MTYNPSLAPRVPSAGGDAAERLLSTGREGSERLTALASAAALRGAGHAERHRPRQRMGSMESIAGAQATSGTLRSLGRA